MAWWGTFIGGTLGFVFGGPLGAIIGAALGGNLDRGNNDKHEPHHEDDRQEHKANQQDDGHSCNESVDHVRDIEVECFLRLGLDIGVIPLHQPDDEWSEQRGDSRKLDEGREMTCRRPSARVGVDHRLDSFCGSCDLQIHSFIRSRQHAGS